ncbi:hypothetical protein TRFO_13117 [Tritrichomonas foetus]|uniref:Uncharacterized protein n=1 Tax=Tritrichomonas foetus TaxID=1144522 RepID=A0A1J4L3I1_9EUKA|nr:hypothetical protein TRFO_13117 [Tritrichomonas foetus]|eukprot:OHT16532.1 hypothetical protein TRFO_13117 [Tritrichomonas foetus]
MYTSHNFDKNSILSNFGEFIMIKRFCSRCFTRSQTSHHCECSPNLDMFSESIDAPIIYLYPDVEMGVDVSLKMNGIIQTIYPKCTSCNNRDECSWIVKAKPTGKLEMISSESTNYSVNQRNIEYDYLFYEGIKPKLNLNELEGFFVKKEETSSFLETKLHEIGLNDSEMNEFIVFWLPRLEKNDYNFICFYVNEKYSEISTLDVNPKPKSILRVFMVFKGYSKEEHKNKLDSEFQFQLIPQTFPPFERKGFTIVEWGGSEFPKT